LFLEVPYNEMMNYSDINWWEVFKYILEFAVLGLIVYEIRKLGKHAKVLNAHSDKLDKAIPLISSLLLDPKDIQNLAIEMIVNAFELRAVGILDVLSRTEFPPNRYNTFKINPASQFDKQYTSSTSDFISAGRSYSRLMNLSIANRTESEIWTILANIRFFKRLMEISGAREIQLRLYHHPSLVSGSNEFHFRVTDKKAVIRVGSHSESSVSAGISITDTRVIGAFVDYFDSLAKSEKCIHLSLEKLRDLDSLLTEMDISGYEQALNKI